MKKISFFILAFAGFALTSCNTARTVGDATGKAVKATGKAVGTVAEGTVNTGRNVGEAVRQDVDNARRSRYGY